MRMGTIRSPQRFDVASWVHLRTRKTATGSPGAFHLSLLSTRSLTTEHTHLQRRSRARALHLAPKLRALRKAVRFDRSTEISPPRKSAARCGQMAFDCTQTTNATFPVIVQCRQSCALRSALSVQAGAVVVAAIPRRHLIVSPHLRLGGLVTATSYAAATSASALPLLQMCETKNPFCDPAFAIRTNVSPDHTTCVALARSDTCFLASQVPAQRLERIVRRMTMGAFVVRNKGRFDAHRSSRDARMSCSGV